MRSELLIAYGLKHNPFSRSIPHDALWSPPGFEAFAFRVESVILDGGFAMLCGEPGLGKSKVLQLINERLLRIGKDIVVGVMERPQSSVGDFYRELGDIFGVELTPNNRYGGFKALREKWKHHIQATLIRPVLIIDESQEVHDQCLTELRLMSNAKFDSEVLLTTILSGDNRLPERFRKPSLIPLGSRIRTRWNLQPWDRATLHTFIEHALEAAGAPHLMTDGLKTTVVEHAAGNLRMLCSMGEQLLHEGAQRRLKQLDEQLYIDCFNYKPKPSAKRRTS